MSTQPIYAIIVAGGQGTRMGTETPKQFLKIKNKEIILHTIDAFLNAIPEAQLIIVHPSAHLQQMQDLTQQVSSMHPIQLVAGGATRFDSVKNGLACIPHEAGIVLIHDGVRPIISASLIKNCIQQAQEKGSAIPAVSLVDSIRKVSNQKNESIDRNTLVAIQTPQTFQVAIIKRAFKQDYQDSFTDDASVVNAMQEPVYLIEGERYNIKITTPEDLIIAEALLNHAE